MGQGLALALKRRGYAVCLLGRSPTEVAPGLTLHMGPWADATAGAELILVATPDDAIATVARRLADDEAVVHGQAVLHLSGLLDRHALDALIPTGAALGSFHPLQTVVDPGSAAERLKGAYAAVEGDPPAVEAGTRLAKTLRMTPVPIEGKAKAAYHAGAVMVSNYVVTLLGVAERLAREAGVPDDLAQRIYLPLLAGASANLAEMGAVRALTGPVRRGDVDTIAAHLGSLPADVRELYVQLGREALVLARKGGLDEPAAARVAAALKVKAEKRS